MPDNVLDIPYQAPSVSAQLAETHARVEIEPNDPKLTFDLLVPKTWAYSSKFGPVRHMLLQAAGLGFFAAGTEPDAPVIGVTATPCPFEVPIDAWARLTVEQEGWTIVASQWFPGPNGLFFDLTATRTVDDVEHVRRTSVRTGHGAIIAVNSMCGRRFWDAVKETFWAAHVTFALVQKPEPNLEHWLRAHADNPAFSTVYPASWKAEPAEAEGDQRSGLHLRLTDQENKTLLAYLLIKAEPNPFPQPLPLPELWNEARRMVEASGVKVTSAPKHLTTTEDPRALAVQGWLGGYLADAHLGTADITLRVGFITRANLIITITACSPQLQDDPLVTLRTQRTFEITRAGLELPS